MNQDGKNRAYFQETFQEVHAPEALAGKVRNMTKTEAKKLGLSVVKKLAVAAAIAAVLFAGSNVVAYATTGSTWLETVVVHFNVNGATYDMEVEGEQLPDGTVQYSTSVEVPDGATATFAIDSDSEWVTEYYHYAWVTDGDEAEVPRTEVVEENGKVYFINGDVKIDITEDMADGQAAGTYEENGMVYQYEVKEEPGAPGCYELHITSEEE